MGMTRFRLLPLAIFIASVMLTVRLGDLWIGMEVDVGGASQAQSPPAAEHVAASATEGLGDKAGGESPAIGIRPVEGPPEYSDAELDILQNLARRRDELERREREIEMRGGLLQAAEKSIDAKIQKLEGLRQTIDGMLNAYEKQEEAKLKSLVKIYESMKPKEAAQIWAELEMPILLQVIERMREQKIASILAKMNPDTARRITIELAQRRKLPKIEG